MHATISFVKTHPVIGGVLFAAFGVFMVYVRIDGAKRFRLYENAQEVTGQVLSITEASRVPPRFDLAVSWSDGPSAEETVIRTGPKAVDDLKIGDTAHLLRDRRFAVRSPAGAVRRTLAAAGVVQAAEKYPPL